MAWIVDYPAVLRQMVEDHGLVSAYFNSGAFTYPRGERVEIVGWIGPDDPSIRPELLAGATRCPPPYGRVLAGGLARAWTTLLSGPAWVLPKSHWSFELDHGNGRWMREALGMAGVDPASFEGLTTAPAIAFDPGEVDAFIRLVDTLLSHLQASDFAVVFPEHRHLVTLHHHQQVWWQTPDPDLAGRLRDLPTKT